MPKKYARRKKTIKKQEKVVETATDIKVVNVSTPARLLLQCSKNSSAVKAALQHNINSSSANKSWDLSHLSDVYFHHIDSPPQITPPNFTVRKLRHRSVKVKNLNTIFCRSADIIKKKAKSPRKVKSPLKRVVKDPIGKQDKIIPDNEALNNLQNLFEEQDNLLVIDMEETRIQTNCGDDVRKSKFLNEDDSFIDANSDTDSQFAENHQKDMDESVAHSHKISTNNLFERDKLTDTSPIKPLFNERLSTDVTEKPSTEENCSENNENQHDHFCKSSPQKLLNHSKESIGPLKDSSHDNASSKKNNSENSLSKIITDQENSQNLLPEQHNLPIVVLDETNKEPEIGIQLINQDNSLKESNINTSHTPDKDNLFERDQAAQNSPVKRVFNEGIIRDKTKELDRDKNSSNSNQNELNNCELFPSKLPKHSSELESATQGSNQDNISFNKSSSKNSLNTNINKENNLQNLIEEHDNLRIIDMEEANMKTFGESKDKLQCIDDDDSFIETNSITESNNDSEKMFESDSNSQNSLKHFITEVSNLLANSPIKKCNAKVISNCKTIEPIKTVVCSDNASESREELSNNCLKSPCSKLDSNDLNKSPVICKGYFLRERSESKKNLEEYSNNKTKQDNGANSSENELSSSEQDYKTNSTESNKSDSYEMETSQSECFSDLDMSGINKLEESSSSVTIGEYVINTSELAAKAVKSWYPPSHVMRNMMSLETKLLMNSSKFYEKLQKSNKQERLSAKKNDKQIKKLLNTRWNQFCELYKFNTKQHKYFYKNPIIVHFFPNLLNYFHKFINQDLPGNVSVKCTQNHFRGLFEPISSEYYSSYEDAVIMALRKRLKNNSVKEEVYLNYIASHALNRNVHSVSRRHTSLKKKNGLISPRKKLNVKRKKSTSSSGSDCSETDEDTNALNETKSGRLKGKFSFNKNEEQVKKEKMKVKSKNINVEKSENADQNDIHENNCEMSEDSRDTVKYQSEKSFDKSSGFHQEETSADEKESDALYHDDVNEDNCEIDEGSFNSVKEKSKKELDKCREDRKTYSSEDEENHADESGIDEDYNVINEDLSDTDKEKKSKNLDKCGLNDDYGSDDEEECVKDGDGSEKDNSIIDGQGSGSLEERISHISKKSQTWISLLDAMLDVTGERRATADNLMDVDLSVKDWRWVSSEVSNTNSQAIPAHIAKALYDSKLHPLMFASRSINNYKLILDIVYALKERDYSSWYEVKWSEISEEMDNLKPLFLFTTFVDFARLYVPLHLQSNIKECINYLLTEKLPFIKRKIKDGITLVGCN